VFLSNLGVGDCNDFITSFTSNSTGSFIHFVGMGFLLHYSSLNVVVHLSILGGGVCHDYILLFSL